MKRLVGTVVGAGVLLLSVAACGQSQDSVGFGGQPAPPPSSPSPTSSNSGGGDETGGISPKLPEGATAVAQDKINASTLKKGQPKVAWTTADGRTVGVYGEEGGCSKVHAELGQQTDSAVTVTLVEQVPETVRACTMDLRYKPLTVQLAAPLAARNVVLDYKQVKVANPK